MESSRQGDYLDQENISSILPLASDASSSDSNGYSSSSFFPPHQIIPYTSQNRSKPLSQLIAQLSEEPLCVEGSRPSTLPPESGSITQSKLFKSKMS